MKRSFCIMLSILLLFSAFYIPSLAQNAETVILSPSDECVIAVPENATPQENYAASTLKDYLYQITGLTVQILPDTKVSGCNAFYLSKNPAFEDGQYKITENGGSIYITGGGLRGEIYGVYAFLEKYCDCHWYTTTLKVIPENEKISVQKNLEYEYTPYFEYTYTDWRCWQSAEFEIANGINGDTNSAITPEMGDTVKYISDFCHTLTSEFCSARSYFETHPEYYALHDGKRTKDQLCLTNPDVLRIVTDEVLDMCKRKCDPTQAVQIISLTQADNKNYCECANCKAVDEQNGSHSGTMISFVNEVAKAVKNAGYDNIAIDTFAYQYTRKAPTQVKPEDNVIIRLCSIECCFGHTLDDKNCELNVEFMKDLEEWGKISGRVYIWDYVNNFSETYNIFPDFGILQRNVQIYYENNAKGLYEEGNYYINDCDGEFGELRAYLLAKLMQNPYMDFDAEMNGFLKAYYGDGWQSIKEFIEICNKTGVTDKEHLNIYQEANKSLPGMTLKDINYCDKLWENAKELANDDFTLTNVKRSEICWRYWKCANRKSEFSLFTSLLVRMKRQEQLYNDMISFGGNCLGERTRMRDFSTCKSMILLRIPIKWSTRYEDWVWRLIDPIIVTFYNFFNC